MTIPQAVVIRQADAVDAAQAVSREVTEARRVIAALEKRLKNISNEVRATPIGSELARELRASIVDWQNSLLLFLVTVDDVTVGSPTKAFDIIETHIWPPVSA